MRNPKEPLGFVLTPEAIVVAIDPSGPADEAGMRNGDELLLLEGTSPHDVSAYGAVRLTITPGQTVSVHVLRPEGEVALPLVARRRSVLLEGHVVSYLAAGLFLFLGIWAYVAVRGAPLGWAYFLFMAAGALALACTVPIGSAGLSALQRVGIGLLPACFVYYAALFPDERPLDRRRLALVWACYLWTLGVALLNAALLLLGQEQSFLWTYYLLDWNLAAGFVVGAALLAWTYVQSPAHATRDSVREMVVGMILAATPFVLLWGLNVLTGFRIIDTRVLILAAQAMPLAMGYAVLKGRWAPLDALVRGLLVLALTLLAGFLIYGAVVWGLVLAFGIAVSGEALAAGFAAAIIMGVVVVPLAALVRRLVDRWFFG
ncbi:MAG: PDZ domain-containing protein [Chloroflexi bacterium]|nr:PDZ domain-containing protein [Chloroflexota bacterium]MBU1746504.1 PDZ domain-containing protein [Chloroflexota bacterium]